MTEIDKINFSCKIICNDFRNGIYLQYKSYVEMISDFLTCRYTSYLSLGFIYKYQLSHHWNLGPFSFFLLLLLRIFLLLLGNHHHHHHHHVVPLARISLTLSHNFSLSFIASGRSSGLHPVSSHSCCMYVLAGRPAFARPYVGVHRSTSLMSSSLLLQQCPACLVCLTWIVFVMWGRWPYSWCLVGCYCQDLFNIALNILV